jgi:peptide/nickel transport system ATP-binding protein
MMSNGVAPPSQSTEPVLQVTDLSVVYNTEKGPLPAVRHVSLRIGQGEIYGLVGESGSGKTTVARAVVRYLPANGAVSGGSVLLNKLDLMGLSPVQMRRVWGSQITMVHQDPSAAVNPSIPIGEQIAEVARVHLGMDRRQAREKALQMLNQVGMSDPEAVAGRYAHQLSGGMLQRVLIATALTTNPQLLIMDEPTTALDVTTEAVILDLVHDLLEQYQTAVLYITHNLGVVARIATRVGVLYAGELMEEGAVPDVFKRKLHPYTLGLLGCVPRVDISKHDVELNTIPGSIPPLDGLPSGCIFAPRCPMAEDACRLEHPTQVEAEPGHLTACRRWQAVPRLPDLFAAPQSEIERGETPEGSLVLDARNVAKHFKLRGMGVAALWRRGPSELRAVDDISIRVRKGHTMGIVGESGCGKTTFARCVAGLVEASCGEMILEGEPLAYSVAHRPLSVLRKIQMVFQNPDASLNPQLSVGACIGRPLIMLGDTPRNQVGQRVRDLLRAVNLPEAYADRLPHELSGGEKQRVAIARALAANPTLMICDEPISSLDVSVQASLMNLLVRLQGAQGTSYLFISHDLAAVRHVSDWIAVVYLGRLWEVGPAEEVFSPPFHPYTEALLSALPIPDPDVRQKRIRLLGSVPSAVHIPPGCRFHTRCPHKIGAVCETEEPAWQNVARYHSICCHIPVDELCDLQRHLLRVERPAPGGKEGER